MINRNHLCATEQPRRQRQHPGSTAKIQEPPTPRATGGPASRDRAWSWDDCRNQMPARDPGAGSGRSRIPPALVRPSGQSTVGRQNRIPPHTGASGSPSHRPRENPRLPVAAQTAPPARSRELLQNPRAAEKALRSGSSCHFGVAPGSGSRIGVSPASISVIADCTQRLEQRFRSLTHCFRKLESQTEPGHLSCSAESKKHISRGDRLAIGNGNRRADAGFFRRDLVHHLHAFDDAQHISRFDRLANLDKGRCTRFRRAIKGAGNG